MHGQSTLRMEDPINNTIIITMGVIISLIGSGRTGNRWSMTTIRLGSCMMGE